MTSWTRARRELASRPLVVAVGSGPNGVTAAATAQLTGLTGRLSVAAEGKREVYLFDPTVLTGVVGPPED